MENSAFRITIRFEPRGIRVTEDEFDYFSEAAFLVEESEPELVECHVSADLSVQYIDVDLVLLADTEPEANRAAESITGAIAHRVDVLAGRNTTLGSPTRTERLTPA